MAYIKSEKAITALREALAEQPDTPSVDCACGDLYPADSFGAGFIAATGHCQNCDVAEQAEHEPFDMDDHPPHLLCECRKCMEYFTPLPDCDAFAASGKPIAEQTNTQFMEGYRIGLAEMREKCATVSEQGTGEAVQKAALELLLNERKRIAAAIRAIKFEGDTGFRPVSEMIAEHKQDHKKGAAIEKAKMRKATRAEKIAMPGVYEVPVEQAEQEPVAFQMICPRCKVDRVTTPCPRGGVSDCPMTATAQSAAQQPVKQEPCGFTAEQQDRFAAAFDVAFAKAGLPQKQPVKQEPVGIVHDSYDTQGIEWKCKDPLPTGTKLYAAPVRTKDLTDEEAVAAAYKGFDDYWTEDCKGIEAEAWLASARAAIAADREKNK